MGNVIRKMKMENFAYPQYRVWDGKIIHSVAELIWCQGGLKWYGPGVGKGICAVNPKFDWGKEKPWVVDSVLMTYLHKNIVDINNKRLCTGDIIDWEKCKWSVTFEFTFMIIRYDNGCNMQLANFLWQTNQNKRGPFEIIGNIYENPKLLGQR